MFTEKLYPAEQIECVKDGVRYVAKCYPDNDHGMPWEEEDGHGEVSKWTTRDKAPGELILCEDGQHRRYYDFAGAVEKAHNEGWGCDGGREDGETDRAYRARAAREDFERLRAWCNDEWCYVGVGVQAFADTDSGDIELTDEYVYAVWGINSDAGDYLTETANELLAECETEARERLQELVNELADLAGHVSSPPNQ